MGKYTINSKFGDLFREPIFQGWQHMLDYRRDGADQELEELTFAAMEQKNNWSAKRMMQGCNYLYEQAQRKQVFYPIWDEKQMQQDSGKKQTGIAAFALEKVSKFAVICPGGGYGAMCSLLEGYPLAKQLNEMGYAAFVICYRVGEAGRQPNPQDDLAAAIRFIGEHAAEFQVDLKEYAVIGFSAGAHLAGGFGIADIGYKKYGLPKPGILFLGYPVITMDKMTHRGSRKNLFGEGNESDRELIETYSIEKNITPDYPKTFVWQCSGDNVVSVENSNLLIQALVKNGVPFCYEVYPYSLHGLDEKVSDYAKDWLKRAVSLWND